MKRLFEPVADHFRKVGKAAGFLVDQYAEYDVFSIQHQIPGGMMGTFKAQLAMHKMMDKLPQVLDEVAAVRRDLGYPGMATPFSQLVGIQAVLNVVTGQRYGTVPDEVIQYAAGFYGQTVAPVDRASARPDHGRAARQGSAGASAGKPGPRCAEKAALH